MRPTLIRFLLVLALAVPCVVAAACGGATADPHAPIVEAASPSASTYAQPSANASAVAASDPPAPPASAVEGPHDAEPDNGFDDAGSFAAGEIGLTRSGNDCRGIVGCRGPDGPSRQNGMIVKGKLPKEIVRRIVFQNSTRLRVCFDDGLRTNPKLARRVTIGFVIASDGSVKNAHIDGFQKTDAAVTECFVRYLGALSFPQPESGEVSVTFQAHFQ